MTSSNLIESLLCHPDESPAIRLPEGGMVTYGELNTMVADLADAMVSAGLRKGDRVAFRGGKSVPTLAFYFACLSAGLIYVPISEAHTRREMEFFINDAQPAALYVDRLDGDAASAVGALPVPRILELPRLSGTGPARRPRPIPLGDADLAALLYTSGTTGVPKGAMITHASLLANARTLVDVWRFTAADVVLHTLPLSHGHGLFLGCHLPLMVGGSIMLAARFNVEEAIDLMPQSTVFMGVPTLYVRLLQSPRFDREACRNLRLMISGSAPLPVDVFEKVAARTGVEIVERFGTTETSICASQPLDGERRPGTVGVRLPDVDIGILDEDGAQKPAGEVGRLAVRGPNVFPGYWNQPDASGEVFTPDGFFLTGDLARLESDGHLTIVGREKDMIISGGLNVYALEVEGVLRRFDGVADCAVIGVPHFDFGEAVVAVIVPEPGARFDNAAVRAFAQEHLAVYKAPKAIVLVEKLPRTTMGKVIKTELREAHRDLFLAEPVERPS